MKSLKLCSSFYDIPSLPTRGEWIEIDDETIEMVVEIGLSPHGESGLKSMTTIIAPGTALSLPTRGEWIEITK